MRVSLLVVAMAALAVKPSAGHSQRPCPAATRPTATLPAYAHNDYENDRPLLDALDLGYRGVEVDLFLVNDTLRIGHDRRRASQALSFEAAYLGPLRTHIAECARFTNIDAPFLLAIELKESSPQALHALRTALEQYAELFVARDSERVATMAPDVDQRLPVRRGPLIEVVLVGWHPPPHFLDSLSPLIRLNVQHRLSSDRARVDSLHPRERLLSLDYGKTIGRWWRTPAAKQRWFALLRAVRRSAPDRLIRAHNVPADPRVYEALREAGVDLIGTKHLARTHRLLQPRDTP